MAAQQSIELFTKTGKLLPLDQIEPQLAPLSDDIKQRFAAVRDAALASEAATAAVKAAQAHVEDCAREVAEASDALRQMRPPVSATEAARDWIQTTRR